MQAPVTWAIPTPMHSRPHYLLLLLLLLAFRLPVLAQKETYHWYIDEKWKVDFNFTPPRVVEEKAIKSPYGGIESIADKTGRVLFLTDGLSVFTRNRTLMQNGESIAKPAIQSTVIVPKPQSGLEYYIFTTE
jgi:hypothetical protein